MRLVPGFLFYGTCLMAASLASGCGGDSGGGADTPDAMVEPSADADPGMPGPVDAAPRMLGNCETGATAPAGAFLPASIGNSWRYRVTDSLGEVTTKSQEYTELITASDDIGEVIVQVTTKADGVTENWLKRDGDAVLRIRQRDFDALGVLERTTCYVPSRTRIDESPDRLVAGAQWTDNYVRQVIPGTIEQNVICKTDGSAIDCDPEGITSSCETVQDQWTVLATDVPCKTDFGELSCVQIQRLRLIGGNAPPKTYWFARGYGKIREEGEQLEELVGCEFE